MSDDALLQILSYLNDTQLAALVSKYGSSSKSVQNVLFGEHYVISRINF